MIKRFFWFAVGAGVAIVVYRKVRELLSKATPNALAGRAADSAAGIGNQVQDFVARVREGMTEREAELRAELHLPD